MQCNTREINQRFGGTYCLYPEGGSSRRLRNFG